MNLESYFDYTYSLMHNHHWSLTEIENMMPWERDIYLMKLEEQLKEEKRRAEAEKHKR